MNFVSVTIHRWEDGKFIKKDMERLDRWEVHAAEEICVTASGVEIVLRQRPDLLPASKVGVGACLWDSSLVLVAHIATQPQHKFMGMKIVELGAGLGLVGLLLAKLGAQVTMTDLKAVVPLIEANIAANNMSRYRPEAGNAEAQELEWGAPHSLETARALAARQLDLVVAADSCYDDQDGVTPNPEHFCTTCKALCTNTTQVLMALERRNEETFTAFMSCAHSHFSRVRRLPYPPADICKDAKYVELYEFGV